VEPYAGRSLADGLPISVEIEQSSRHRELDQAAIQAVKKWRFNPEIRDGKPIAGVVLVPIDFKLTEG